MSTKNEVWLNTGQKLEALDLFEDTALVPTVQVNDRTKPDSFQGTFSPEFSAPATAHNHRLLSHAASSQSVLHRAYRQTPALLLSAGVEVLPNAILLIKGYSEGAYQLQLLSGNINFVQALKNADGSDKKLNDLDLNRFNHDWTPQNILDRLTYDYWAANQWGYEIVDRGKPLDLAEVDPYSLYPSVAYSLVAQQIATDAGFTMTDLRSEPFYAALNIPTANPYEFSQDFRDARQLTAGFFYDPKADGPYHHRAAFPEEQLLFSYVSRKPYHAPDVGTASYQFGRFVADTNGFYDISATIPVFLGINSNSIGSIRCKFQLKVNGQVNFDGFASDGHDEKETDKTITHTFNPKLTHYHLQPGDEVTLWWNGDEIGPAPSGTHWHIGPYGAQTPLPGGQLVLASEVRLSVTLLAQFPPSGLVRLQDWLPDLTQLEFFTSFMLLLGLTIQPDAYRPHLHLYPGTKLLQNIPQALDWSNKLDAYARPGRLPERSLSYRFGDFGQINKLVWTEDSNVTPGYGDGTILIDDQVLQPTYQMAKLPFAATEPSPDLPTVLRILNFEAQNITTTPIQYSSVEAKPRVVLKSADRELRGLLILVPQRGKPGDQDYREKQLIDFTSTASYFVGADLSLDLNSTCLTRFWSDMRAILDETRYLVERLRLTPRDMAELNFSRPVWIAAFNDFFAVSVVREYSPNRSVEVTLCRLNPTHLPEPVIPGDGQEFWGGEFAGSEFY